MRPLRNKSPENLRLITTRTLEARLFITPQHEVRKLLGGILARYQELLKIEIYAYCFLSNHFHLLIRAPLGNTDEFMENVNREISRRLNYKLEREGKFWGRRYSEQLVLSDEDALQAFLYINTNPTKHGLVHDSISWPGLNSYQQSILEEELKFSFYHYSAKDYEEQITVHSLKLSPLPIFQQLSHKKRSIKIKRLLSERTLFLVKERIKNGKGFLGLEYIQHEQELGTVPLNVSKSCRPKCYTKDPILRREFKQRLRDFNLRYREASVRYRLGLEAKFPMHSYLPPLQRKPRIERFVELKAGDFSQVV